MSTLKYLTRRLAGLILGLALALPAARAHEIRPAYLDLKETAPGQYDVLWRTPVLSGMRLPLALQMPADVRNLREPQLDELTDSLVERRWVDAGPGGIEGKRIDFPVFNSPSPTCWCASSGSTAPIRPTSSTPRALILKFLRRAVRWRPRPCS